jgi:nucleotide-binding universal stress UspA family protein
MTIIHPTDFSDAAQGAEQQAVRLARALSAELILLHALGELPLAGMPLPGTPDNESIRARQRQEAEKALRARDSVIRELGVAVRWIVREGGPAEAIVRAAVEEHADLIVIGTHGRSGLDRLLIGSVADRVVRRAPCPVMTVRERSPAAS